MIFSIGLVIIIIIIVVAVVVVNRPLNNKKKKKNVAECIVCVPGHDPLTFFFPVVLSLFFFYWAGVLWP